MRSLFRTLVVAIATLVLTAGPSRAGTILYFSDGTLGTDRMAQALASPAVTGQHTVTTSPSLAAFTAAVATGNFDLVIFFEQNSNGAAYDAAWAAVAAHIAGGGLAIGDDWTRSNTHAAAFNTTFTNVNNQTGVTVTDPLLLTGITNPVDLFNPGWGAFSTGLTADAPATSAATFANGNSAIVFNKTNGTIFNGFLSDTFVNGPEGQRLYTNQINAIFGLAPSGGGSGSAATPEPTTLVAFGLMGAAGFGYVRRRLKGMPVVA